MQMMLLNTGGISNGLPVGTGKVLSSRDYAGAGSFLVQTPDDLWSMMIARMKRQSDARARGLAKWEAKQPAGARLGAGYWERYNAEKAKHRVDYPMPWGHVMFGT